MSSRSTIRSGARAIIRDFAVVSARETSSEPPPAMASLRFQATDVSASETGFRIETRIKDSGAAWRVDATLAALTGTGLTIDETLRLYQFNTAYDWQVVAVNGAGSSFMSGGSVYTAPNLGVTGLSATTLTARSIELGWTEPSPAPATGYEVWCGDLGAEVFIKAVASGAVSTTIAGLNPSTTYSIYLVAVNDNTPFGYVDAVGPRSAPVSARTWAELNSVIIPVDGLSLRLNFSEVMTFGAGGNGGVTLALSGGAVALAYASGDGTNTLVFTPSRTILVGETGTFDFTQPGNGIETVSTGRDHSSVTGGTLDNQSTAASYFLAIDFEGARNPTAAGSAGSFNGSYTPALAGTVSGAQTAAGYRSWLFPSKTSMGMFLLVDPVGENSRCIDMAFGQFGVEFRSDRVTLHHGTVTTTSLGASNAPTAVWLDYVAASGAGNNGTLHLYMVKNSTSRTRPVSPLLSITTGTGAAVNAFVMRTYSNNTLVYDHVRCADVPIGSNPS